MRFRRRFRTEEKPQMEKPSSLHPKARRTARKRGKRSGGNVWKDSEALEQSRLREGRAERRAMDGRETVALDGLDMSRARVALSGVEAVFGVLLGVGFKRFDLVPHRCKAFDYGLVVAVFPMA